LNVIFATTASFDPLFPERGEASRSKVKRRHPIGRWIRSGWDCNPCNVFCEAQQVEMAFVPFDRAGLALRLDVFEPESGLQNRSSTAALNRCRAGSRQQHCVGTRSPARFCKPLF
jgi:hypothetical protein